MQKILKFFMVLCLCIMPFAIVGCGGTTAQPESFDVSGLPTIVEVGTELDTSSVTATVTYDDGTTQSFGNSTLSFSQLDTSTTGVKELTITWTSGDYTLTTTKQITVVEQGIDVFVSSLSSGVVNEYNAKRSADITSETTLFSDNEQPLYVGDDNAFDFRMNVVFRNSDGQMLPDVGLSPKTDVTVELYNGTSYITLTEDATNVDEKLSTYVVINEDTTFDFTDEAIDKTFRITVSAVHRHPNYIEEDVTFTAEVVVCDGYNVYDAEDLMVYDNTSTYYETYRQEHDMPNSINGVILQADIQVTTEYVDPDLLWQKGDANFADAQAKTNLTLEGTPKNTGGRGLYKRVIASGETFNFIGNYFTIDLSQFPKAVVEQKDNGSYNGVQYGVDDDGNYVKDNCITSFYSAFYHVASEDGSNYKNVNINENTQINWKNISFVGNSTYDSDPRNSGGILLMKDFYINFSGYNTIMNNCYLGYFFNYGNPLETDSRYEQNEYIGTYKIEKTKTFNSFQCSLYVYGSNNVVVKDSIMKNSGGPAIIADHVDMDNNDVTTGFIPGVNLINTTVEAKCSGKEPWFDIYKVGTIMGQLQNLEMLFDGTAIDTGKTVFAGTQTIEGKPVGQFNIIGIIKKGGEFEITSTQIVDGYIRIFNTEQDYDTFYANESENKTSQLNMSGNAATSSRKDGLYYVEDGSTNGYCALDLEASGTDMLSNSSAMADIVVTQILNGMSSKLEDLGKTIPDTYEERFALLTDVISNNLVDDSACIGILTQFKSFMSDEEYNTLVALGGKIGLTQFINSLNESYASYYDGDYIGLYLPQGVGALIQVYSKA